MALVRFRILGIPVDVQPWFLVVAGVSALRLRSPPLVLIWMATVTTSVLWHELGHALTMRWFGYAPRIELHAMGGLAHWPIGANPSARQALLVTAAGPFAGLQTEPWFVPLRMRADFLELVQRTEGAKARAWPGGAGA